MAGKQLLRSLIRQESAEWLDRQPAKLGDGTGTSGGTVLTETAGVYYARLINGKVIQVYNQALLPPIPDMNVLIGRTKTQPTVWQIIHEHEVYDEPIAQDQTKYHHAQHEEGGGDQLFLDYKQINQLSVRVYDAANFIVQVKGAIVPTASGIKKITTQNIDVSSYVVTSGAKIITIESDDDGALTVHEGTPYADPAIGTDANIPVPASGKHSVAGIVLYGQSALADADIFPIVSLPGAADVGAAIHAAAASAVTDSDEFGFWEDVSGLLKKITWANIKATLKTYFDTLYAVVGAGVTNGDSHDHSGGDGAQISFLTLSNSFNDAEGDPAAIGTADDGTSDYPARRDHVHAISSGQSVLSSSFSITGNSGVYQDTGLYVDLPEAGTYELIASVRGLIKSDAGNYITAQFYNSTDSAYVSDSETLVIYASLANTNMQNSVVMLNRITVAAAKTIKLYAARNYTGTVTLSNIDSNTAGKTRMTWKKVG